MPEDSSDRAAAVFVVGTLAVLIVVAGLVWERYSPRLACAFFVLLQIILTTYGMALKPGSHTKSWWKGDAFFCAAFLITNILVLPFFLRSAFHAFGSKVFSLGSSKDTLWDWTLYVADQIIDAVALGVPSTFSLALSDIEHSGPYGPFVVSYVRLIAVAQFVLVITNLWKSKKMA